MPSADPPLESCVWHLTEDELETLEPRTLSNFRNREGQRVERGVSGCVGYYWFCNDTCFWEGVYETAKGAWEGRKQWLEIDN